MKAYNPEFKARIEKHLKKQEFMHHMGFNLDVIEVGKTEGRMELKEIHNQQTGLVHGGVIATAADIVSGFAAYMLVGPKEGVVTGELKVSYLRPGKGDTLYAVGWVIKQGRKITFCEAEVYVLNGAEKTLIAKATSSMVIV